jgi:hypothetical protein
MMVIIDLATAVADHALSPKAAASAQRSSPPLMLLIILALSALVVYLVVRSQRTWQRCSDKRRSQRAMERANAAATCHQGNTATTSGVVHGVWNLLERGEDRRGPAEGWPRGRIRWYYSHQCSKCGVIKSEFSEWDTP